MDRFDDPRDPEEIEELEEAANAKVEMLRREAEEIDIPSPWQVRSEPPSSS